MTSDGLYSLEKDPKKRPTPLQMLKHPWIIKSEAREVDMAKWVAQIWNVSFSLLFFDSAD